MGISFTSEGGNASGEFEERVLGDSLHTGIFDTSLAFVGPRVMLPQRRSSKQDERDTGRAGKSRLCHVLPQGIASHIRRRSGTPKEKDPDQRDVKTY